MTRDRRGKQSQLFIIRFYTSLFTFIYYATVVFPYLKAGSYCIRITEDINRNNMVDTGVLLEHKQPEKVRFFKLEDQFLIKVLERAEMVWQINLKEMFQ